MGNYYKKWLQFRYAKKPHLRFQYMVVTWNTWFKGLNYSTQTQYRLLVWFLMIFLETYHWKEIYIFLKIFALQHFPTFKSVQEIPSWRSKWYKMNCRHLYKNYPSLLQQFSLVFFSSSYFCLRKSRLRNCQFFSSLLALSSSSERSFST